MVTTRSHRCRDGAAGREFAADRIDVAIEVELDPHVGNRQVVGTEEEYADLRAIRLAARGIHSDDARVGRYRRRRDGRPSRRGRCSSSGPECLGSDLPPMFAVIGVGPRGGRRGVAEDVVAVRPGRLRSPRPASGWARHLTGLPLIGLPAWSTAHTGPDRGRGAMHAGRGAGDRVPTTWSVADLLDRRRRSRYGDHAIACSSPCDRFGHPAAVGALFAPPTVTTALPSALIVTGCRPTYCGTRQSR